MNDALELPQKFSEGVARCCLKSCCSVAGAGLTLRGFYRQNSAGFVRLSGAQCWELGALHVLGGKGGIVGVVI